MKLDNLFLIQNSRVTSGWHMHSVIDYKLSRLVQTMNPPPWFSDGRGRKYKGNLGKKWEI